MLLLIIHSVFLFFLVHAIVKKKSLSSIWKWTFVIKSIAVPVYFYFFQFLYGDFFHFDAGKYFNDALVLKKFFLEHPRVFINYLTDKLSFNDYALTLHYIKDTFNWDDGFNVRWIYNDNKLIILLNMFLSFFSNNNYFIHALWFCFLSWLGVFLVIQNASEKISEEKILKAALILTVFFPFFWFYTGAVLKEPLLVFLFGLQFYFLNKIKHSDLKRKIFFGICFTAFIFLIRVPVMLTFSMALVMAQMPMLSFITKNYIRRLGFFFLFMAICAFVIQTPPFNSSMNAKRIPYLDIQQGGIFLKVPNREFEYRFDYDTTLIRKIPGTNHVKIIRPATYKIHKPEWDGKFHKHTDTSLVFQIIDIVRPAKTTVTTIEITNINSSVYFIGQTIYHFLMPTHFSGLMEKIYALENIFLVLILFLLIHRGNMRFYFMVIFFLFFMIYTCYTSPNIGSVARYRCVWMPCLLYEGSVLLLNLTLRNRKI
jgi:hypothetical protein